MKFYLPFQAVIWNRNLSRRPKLDSHSIMLSDAALVLVESSYGAADAAASRQVQEKHDATV